MSYDADGVILTGSDQPLASVEAIKLVLTNRVTNHPIVASQYAGTVGLPAYFEREFFPELMALKPEDGCESLIIGSPSDQLVRRNRQISHGQGRREAAPGALCTKETRASGRG